jgi:transcriptional regulator with XRE-family HTH domain
MFMAEPITTVIASSTEIFCYGLTMPKHNDHDKICRRLAELLTSERKRHASMTQFAVDAGLTQPGMSFFESHKRTPSFKTLLKIADALEVDLGRFVSRAIKDVRGESR